MSFFDGQKKKKVKCVETKQEKMGVEIKTSHTIDFPKGTLLEIRTFFDYRGSLQKK